MTIPDQNITIPEILKFWNVTLSENKRSRFFLSRHDSWFFFIVYSFGNAPKSDVNIRSVFEWIIHFTLSKRENEVHCLILFFCDFFSISLPFQGQDFTLRQTEGGWRAISKGKLVSATRTHAFLVKVFGDNLGPVRAALRALGAQRFLPFQFSVPLFLQRCTPVFEANALD